MKRTLMPVSAQSVWDWHERPDAFARLNPPWDPVEVLERTGGLEVGARTVVRMMLGPIPQTWVAVHTKCDPGKEFEDTQQSGPFSRWVHSHRFIDEGARSTLEDRIEFALPLSAVGQAVAGPFTQSALGQVFDYRHRVTTLDLERHAKYADRPRLKVAISGASGVIGSALKAFLSTGGHEVRPMRRGSSGTDIDVAALAGADAVVHLAGAGVADGRWTNARKRELVGSRVDFTRALVKAIGGLAVRPRVLVSGSAIGIYGDRADEALTEASSPGPRKDEKGAAFLSKLCEDWEAEALPARALGVRVVLARTGAVLNARGGALAKMLPPFKAGAGGPIAGGKQWMSWICLEDTIGAIHHALQTETLEGPVNLVAPNPVTNGEFGKTLGRVLSRPAIVPVPAFALRLAFGEMAEGTVLPSQRVLPKALEASGFQFVHPQLEQTLRFTLGKT